VVIVRVSEIVISREHPGGQLLSGRGFGSDRANERASTLPSSNYSMTRATMKGVGICTLGLASGPSYLVPWSVTAIEAASDSLTLVFMMLGIRLLIPVMISYNACQYMVFRGEVTALHYGG
jgi:cytochrome bd-type quinol oxidase subunit 2